MNQKIGDYIQHNEGHKYGTITDIKYEILSFNGEKIVKSALDCTAISSDKIDDVRLCHLKNKADQAKHEYESFLHGNYDIDISDIDGSEVLYKKRRSSIASN